jgi:hypothetical protein
MDYNSLTLQIQNYVNRSDNFFISQIPNFINQGIGRIYSEGKGIGFEKIQVGNFTIGSSVITKPTDWKKTISLSYIIPDIPPTVAYVLPRSYEFCRAYSPSNITGNPVFYADYSLPPLVAGLGQLFLSPTPGVAYTYQLIYASYPQFSSSNSTNFLTDRYPSLLLYACLLEAIPFLKDDERVAIWEGLYNRAFKDFQADNISRFTDRLSRREE